jgi:endonuclease YncB( thermonuclease family)
MIGRCGLAGLGALGALWVGLLAAGPARADPCTAPLPKKGAVFSGRVTYVGDGDSLCIGSSPDPASWIEVRLADFYAPELHSPDGPSAKAALERVTRGKTLQCRADHRSYDRVVASCRAGGVSVGALMRGSGIPESGNGYSRRVPSR